MNMADKTQLLSPLIIPGLPKYVSLLSHNFMQTAVWTFAELGIADLLAAVDQPQTADELARKQGWNSEFLYRLLRAVTIPNIVREIKSDQITEPENNHRFELTEDGRFLISDHPSKTRYFVSSVFGSLFKNVSSYLPQLVREGYAKGNGIEQMTGNQPIFNFFNNNRKHSFYFNEAMTTLTLYAAQAVANAIDFSPFKTLVDIGGSLGTLLSHILLKHSTIKKGICFDLPLVIEQAKSGREFIQLNISKDRYEFISGDMFDSKTIPQADAYIMKSIIHDWNDDRAIDILKAIRLAANGEQVTVFIIDLIILPDIEEDKFVNWSAYGSDINMLMTVSGKERTEKQHEYLFKQSGFRLKCLYRTETPYSIIEAITNEKTLINTNNHIYLSRL
jgi:hypothetical protein